MNALKLDEMIIGTLGRDYSNAGTYRFDLALAATSLRFFSLENVPRLSEVLPDRIFDVSYAVLLNESDGVPALE